ncbi:GerAB/ArcD/ProY family transporter [Salirhabdus sp. Marseille-P4669]|uniref:GerAB/ArcD/ProY family transporter n=1 Tax=Salirhabdus sp. Marseille-P4669 TaxID=2042310 RepID=UPI000C7C9491|nr:GerAB/ArcD/ProY family transporter [Salirhabdus sp. Marseille-P4669]
MSSSVPDRLKVSPGLVFFLVTSIQVGVGILSFQTTIVEKAGYDSWMSIIIAGISVHIIIWLIYKMLMKEHKDVLDIHVTIFGKWLSKVFGVLFVFYFILLTISVLRIYIEVIQVWMFPEINLLVITTILAILIFYIVNGGFRVVVGICFLGFVIPLYLILTLLFPLEFAHYENLTPIFTHSIKEIMNASITMTFSYIGFSTLLFYYPFIKKPEKSHKYAHFGVAFTTFLYLAVAFVTFVFYDEEQIKTVIYPTLGIWKIMEMPFVERFEYIGISSWLLVILPNMTLSTWAASRAIKRLFGLKQRIALVLILVISIIGVLFLKGYHMIDIYAQVVTYIGFGIVYGYIPLLFIIYTIVLKVRKSK